MSATAEDKKVDEEEVKGAESTAEFKAVVKLQEVKTANGEEDEEVLYKHRCALYRFAHEGGIQNGPPEWKERGKGDVKLLQHKESKKVRVIMRQEKTLKCCCNHFVAPLLDLTANAGSDRSWTWAVLDYADPEPKDQTFAIRFKDAEIAGKFKDEWDKAREINKALKFDVAPAVDTKTDAKPAETKGEEPVGDAAPTAVVADDDDDTVWMVTILNAKFDPLSDDAVKALWEKALGGPAAKASAADFAKVMGTVVDTIVAALSLSGEKLEKIESEKAKIAKIALAGRTEVTYEEFLKVEDLTLVMET